MKIAIVSGTPAFPPNEGNRVRILMLMQSLLAQGHDIWFLYLPTWSLGDVDEAAHTALLGQGRFVELAGEMVHGIAPMLFRLQRKFRKILGSDKAYYNHIDEYFHPAWSAQLSRLHREIEFDSVIVEYAFHSKALISFPNNVLKVIDSHDCFADRHRLFAQTKDAEGYWVSFSKSVENRAFQRADVVLGIQDEETEAFARRLEGSSTKVETVSHIAGLDGIVDDYVSEDFVFLGSENDANVESIGWFISDVFPLVVKARPQSRLIVAGGVCRRVSSAPNIIKLGRVERVLDAFRLAPVSINPMRVGTGINIKLLDAMAAGVATVTTRTGSRGLSEEYQSGVRIVEDDDAEAFAEELLKLCSSQSERRAVGEAAYQAALAWNRKQLQGLRVALGHGVTRPGVGGS